MSRRSKSEGKNKKQKQKSTAQLSRQRQHLMQDRPTLLKRISEHPIMLAMGMIATVAVLVGLIYDAIRQPDISVDAVIDQSRPFAFPFIVQNESWLFDMRNTEFNCGIYVVRVRSGNSFSGMTIRDSSKLTIEPKERGLFQCSIGLHSIGANSPNDLVEGRLTLSVNYRTLFFPRRSPGIEFTWLTEGNPPHWIKGVRAKQ